MSKDTQRVLAIVVLLLVTALIEGEVLAQTAVPTTPLGRTFVYVKSGIYIPSSLREFALKRVSTEIRERQLGEVVQLEEKEMRRKCRHELAQEYNLQTFLEINEFTLNMVRAQSGIRFPTVRFNCNSRGRNCVEVRVENRVHLEVVTVVAGITVLDASLAERGSGTALGRAEGYTSTSTSIRGLYEVSGYPFTTRDILSRQATSAAIAELLKNSATIRQ